MPIVDLRKFSGLAISYDGENLIPQEAGVTMGAKDVCEINEIRPQILNPDLSCPEIFYYVFPQIDIKSLLKRKNLRFDLYVIPANLAGIEYVKTKGLNAGDFPVLVDVANGFLSLLLQKTIQQEGNLPITRSVIVKLKRGEKYVVPPGWTFVMINSRQVLSIVSLIYSNQAALTEEFDDSRGAANYIIRKNARQEVVRNPAFRNVESTKRLCRLEDVYKVFNLTSKTPILKQILRKYQRFKWLHEAEGVDWTKLPNID